MNRYTSVNNCFDPYDVHSWRVFICFFGIACEFDGVRPILDYYLVFYKDKRVFD